MSSAVSTPSVPVPKRQAVPPLANGDRLSRGEFERRYRAMPPSTRAELIEGTVYLIPSPVRYQSHSAPHGLLVGWITYYTSKTKGLSPLGDNGTVRLDNDNEPQPDIFLMLPPKAGGLAKIDADDYVSGAPALVCEVAASSTSIDLHSKKNAYRRNGVQEYLVWRTEDSIIDWFSLLDGEFVLLKPEADGTLRSRVFPGLWLNPASVLTADLPAMFALLERGTSASEHADFVKRLAAV
jgi:Uma2 family endonuclease